MHNEHNGKNNNDENDDDDDDDYDDDGSYDNDNKIKIMLIVVYHFKIKSTHQISWLTPRTYSLKFHPDVLKKYHRQLVIIDSVYMIGTD